MFDKYVDSFIVKFRKQLNIWKYIYIYVTRIIRKNPGTSIMVLHITSIPIIFSDVRFIKNANKLDWTICVYLIILLKVLEDKILHF